MRRRNRPTRPSPGSGSRQPKPSSFPFWREEKSPILRRKKERKEGAATLLLPAAAGARPSPNPAYLTRAHARQTLPTHPSNLLPRRGYPVALPSPSPRNSQTAAAASSRARTRRSSRQPPRRLAPARRAPKDCLQNRGGRSKGVKAKWEKLRVQFSGSSWLSYWAEDERCIEVEREWGGKGPRVGPRASLIGILLLRAQWFAPPSPPPVGAFLRGRKANKREFVISAGAG